MSKYRDFARGDTLPASWTDAIAEFISTFATDFEILLVNPTTVRIFAGTDNDQVGIGINGKWRYISAPVTAAHPGGAPGLYDVYVTGSDNSFSNTPSPDTDNTVYAFGLEIHDGATHPATVLYRKVGQLAWDGSSIVGIYQTVGSALPVLSVGSAELQDGAVIAAKIGSAAVTASKMAALAVATAALQDGAVTTPKLADNSVTAAKLVSDATVDANRAVTRDHIRDASVTGVKIAAAAVTGSKLALSSVDSPNLVTGAVTAAKIAAAAVGTTALADGSVVTAKIADGNVVTAKLLDGAVTTAKIAALAVGTAQLADGSVTAAKLAAIAALTLRRTTSGSIATNAWTSVGWSSLARGEGSVFWNGVESFDLLEAGWHHIVGCVNFDTAGAIGVRILDMSAGGIEVARSGIYATAGFAGEIAFAFYDYRAFGTEYIVQVLNTAGGSLAGGSYVTARVER